MLATLEYSRVPHAEPGESTVSAWSYAHRGRKKTIPSQAGAITTYGHATCYMYTCDFKRSHFTSRPPCLCCPFYTRLRHHLRTPPCFRLHVSRYDHASQLSPILPPEVTQDPVRHHRTNPPLPIPQTFKRPTAAAKFRVGHSLKSAQRHMLFPVKKQSDGCIRLTGLSPSPRAEVINRPLAKCNGHCNF